MPPDEAQWVQVEGSGQTRITLETEHDQVACTGVSMECEGLAGASLQFFVFLGYGYDLVVGSILHEINVVFLFQHDYK